MRRMLCSVSGNRKRSTAWVSAKHDNVACFEEAECDGECNVSLSPWKGRILAPPSHQDHIPVERRMQDILDSKDRQCLKCQQVSSEGKEVDKTLLLNDTDDSVDCGDNHFTYLTQFESNDGVGDCENFKHTVKNNSESLRSDITGHVSKSLILWLRGGGLKDDRKGSDNDQKDKEDKKN
eukprot:6746642-Ditylum_brightwellii.AAC.1